jgi:hypothetical protein
MLGGLGGIWLVDIIPDLQTCIIILGFGFGYLLGNAFYNFDGEVKYESGKTWYDSLNPAIRYVVSALLDVGHHWEYGLLSIIIGYKYLTGDWQVFAWYFGWGLIVADLKDFENILIRLGLKAKPTEETTTTVTTKTEVSPTVVVTTVETPKPEEPKVV